MRFAVLLLAACRISFDARSDGAVDDGPTDDSNGDVAAVCRDVPTGHDEDGDGVDDGCDVCPHVADQNQLDSDGDRVGEACDPEPMQPRQQIVLFDPFNGTRDAGWTETIFGPGTVSIANDQLLLTPGPNAVALHRPYTAAMDHFTVRAAVPTASLTTNLFGIFAPQLATSSAFYCELLTIDTAYYLKLTQQLNGGAFTTIDSTTFAMPIVGGGGTMQFDVTPNTVACVSTWRGQTTNVSGPRPAGVVPEQLRLYADGADITVDYFLHIRTQ